MRVEKRKLGNRDEREARSFQASQGQGRLRQGGQARRGRLPTHRALVLLAAVLAPTSLPAQVGSLPPPAPATLPKRPLGLSDVVLIALEQSPRLGAVEAAYRGAAARRSAASRARAPKLDLAVSYLNAPVERKRLIPRTELAGLDREQLFAENIGTVAAGISLPIYTGGFLSAQLDRAREGVTVFESRQASTRDRLILDVAGAYLTGLALQDEVVATRASLEGLEEGLRVARRRLEVGRAPPIEVLRIESRVAGLREQLIQAENDFRLTLERIETLTGVRIPDGTIALADTLRLIPFEADLELAVLEAYDNRPELREAGAGVGLAQAGLRMSRSAYFPHLVLGVSAGITGDLNRLDRSSLVEDVFLTIGVSLPLFDRVIGARVSESRASVREAEENRERVRLEVALEVETAHRRLREAAERVEAGRAGVAASEEAHRLERRRFEVGRATVTDLLAAQAEELTSRVGLARALAAHEFGRVSFLRAAGRLPDDPESLAAALDGSGGS